MLMVIMVTPNIWHLKAVNAIFRNGRDEFPESYYVCYYINSIFSFTLH